MDASLLVGCSFVGCSVGCSVDFVSLADCSTAGFSLFLPQPTRLIDTTMPTVTGIRNLFIIFIVFYYLSLLRIIAVTDCLYYIGYFSQSKSTHHLINKTLFNLPKGTNYCSSILLQFFIDMLYLFNQNKGF